jgi:hypothetical protein
MSYCVISGALFCLPTQSRAVEGLIKAVTLWTPINIWIPFPGLLIENATDRMSLTRETFASQFCRLQDWGQGVAVSIPSEGCEGESVPDLCPSSGSLLAIFGIAWLLEESPCVYIFVQMSPLYKNASHFGLGTTRMTWFLTYLIISATPLFPNKIIFRNTDRLRYQRLNFCL